MSKLTIEISEKELEILRDRMRVMDMYIHDVCEVSLDTVVPNEIETTLAHLHGLVKRAHD